MAPVLLLTPGRDPPASPRVSSRTPDTTKLVEELLPQVEDRYPLDKRAVDGGETHEGAGWLARRNRLDKLLEALFPLK